MWDFLSKNCGIFSSKGGTKIWDFRRQGGDFRRSGFGHTEFLDLHQNVILKEFYYLLISNNIQNVHDICLDKC